MKLTLRYLLPLLVAAFFCGTVTAQTTKWKEIHKVKKKETIFGIARDNGITVEELVKANPEMASPDYKLKKGETIFIPYPAANAAAKPSAGTAAEGWYKPRSGPEDADIAKTLRDKNAARCDLIVGPLYSKQVKPLSDFAREHDIKVLIPFSINAPEISSNRNIFQVYQSPSEYNEAVIGRFLEKFSGYHTVFVDCNDTTSKKGVFTFGLRRRMETMGRSHSITNLKSTEQQFAKAFSATMPNVVVLNTGRSPELNVAFAKLNNLAMNNTKLTVTMFGYTEWMMYTKYNLDNYYKFDTYIPASFYMNPLSAKTARIEQKFRWNFHTDMQQALPRFAITGFDHAYYFIKGLHMHGKQFNGARGVVGYTPIQTPLHFERVAEGGGYRNGSILFVHYTTGHRIETLNF